MMSKPKFTKGPWRALPSGMIYDSRDRHVGGASFSLCKGKAPAWEFNAKLMAAAPDLYAALLPIAEEINMRVPGNCNHPSWNEDAHAEITLTIKDCRAIFTALKKARGK